MSFRPADDVVVRAAAPDDREFLHRMIYQAWRWDRPFDEGEYRHHRTVQPEDFYVDEFPCRTGDVGVIAEIRAVPVGAAWCRLVTAAEKSLGFVADDIPELALAVEPDARSRGIGRVLLRRLAGCAAAGGFPALSLHVVRANVQAHTLYESCGFRIHRQTGEGAVLIRDSSS